jgi:RsiW-degrading membrane proteinase PrsW (M82 family)
MFLSSNFFLLSSFFALAPPLVLLAYYYYRLQHPPRRRWLLLFFVVGMISGFVALGLSWVFETLASSVVNWQRITRTLAGVALRQLVAVGPIEEGCKLAGIFFPILYLQRWYRVRPSTLFLYTIAVALGFTAEENWIYLSYGTASIIDRLIGTPVHAMFAAPWGYALAIYLTRQFRLFRYRRDILTACLNAVICHAGVNFLSNAWRYPLPWHFLGYGLFPFFLWMFWRLEGFWRKVQGKRPIILISGRTPKQRFWRRFLVLCVLLLGGNGIFGLFLLVRDVSPMRKDVLLYPDVFWIVVSHLMFNLMLGLLAWGIYRYLRRR